MGPKFGLFFWYLVPRYVGLTAHSLDIAKLVGLATPTRG